MMVVSIAQQSQRILQDQIQIYPVGVKLATLAFEAYAGSIPGWPA